MGKMAKATRPFLKWAGGKTRLLPVLSESAPPVFNRYHEPFLGGGALFFALWEAGEIEKATLSDSNPDLVNAYLQVRDNLDGLLSTLRQLSDEYFSETDRAAAYYHVRSDEPTEPISRAARLLFLNKTCFNGLYRVNQSGRFNVPHGRYKNPRVYDPDLLRRASAALKVAELKVADFEQACSEVSPNDFVYFDPPYHPVSETARFTSYTAKDFGWDDQVRLADVAHSLAEAAFVLVSNSAHSDVEGLYAARGFAVTRVSAPRSINSNGARRGPVGEMLAVNYPISSELSSSPKKNRSQVSRSSRSTTFPVLSR